jgi:hypothetical protein
MHMETWTRSAGAIRDWVGTAPAGAEMVYAQERHLARGSEGAALVRRLVAGGHVTCFQRPLGGGVKAYVIHRLRLQRGSVGRAPKPAVPKLDGDMARVMNILRACARDRLPCPTNRDLAKRAGVGNADQASYVLKKLVRDGFIRVTIVNAATGQRVVTILATSAQTAGPAGTVRP